ncbi:MAG: M28 family metallopeptidase [Fimbriimonadaceae bacterium]
MVVELLAMAAATQGQPDLPALLAQVSATRMEGIVRKLAAYHTRNTLSETLNDAAAWVADEWRAIPGMQVELMRYTLPRSRRVPEDKEVVQVVATLPGETDRRILVGGHLDSLNLQVDAATGRAPGANDDASGVALTMELARILATRKWRNTLVFVAFTGEEQGLYGSRALATRAKDEGWKIDGVLNNDTVGSSSNLQGQKEEKAVRVFSDEDAATGSRELARFCEWAVRQAMDDFRVKLVFRRDRFGRGGDHTPFAEAGFPAVRFIEVYEEYTRQHTPDDLPEHMDWAYLERVAKANLAVMASMAAAGPAPTNVRIDRAQGHDTTLTWNAEPDVRYTVYWRDTASPVWQGTFDAGAAGRYTVLGINKDDHFFAVAAHNGVPVPAQ